MLDERVQALEERAGRIETKVDALGDRMDRRLDQVFQTQADSHRLLGALTEMVEGVARNQAVLSDKVNGLASDLKAVEVTQADMRGQISKMPSTWTLVGLFVAMIATLLTGLAVMPALWDLLT